MGGGLVSRCVGRVYGTDGAVRQKGTLNELYFTPVHLIYRKTQQHPHGNPEFLAPGTYCL